MKHFLIAIIFLQSSVFCQFTSLSVAGINFKLGMSFESALRNCEVTGYNFHKVGSDSIKSFYIVKDTLDIFNEILNSPGMVSFLDGKIESVQKFWGSYQEEDLFRFLSDLFTILSKSNHPEIYSIIRLTDYYEPLIQSKFINIDIQNKTIIITFMEGHIDMVEEIKLFE